MGLRQSKHSSSSSDSEDKENQNEGPRPRHRQFRDLPPASQYTLVSAVEVGQRAYLEIEKQLRRQRQIQEAQSTVNRTVDFRISDNERAKVDHENRIRELEARAFQVRGYRDRDPDPGENIANADEPQGAGADQSRNRGQREGRPKIRCNYCRKELTAGPYIHQHVKLHCHLAPLHMRGVRRGICPHCGKDLSVPSLRRHASGPCTGTGDRSRRRNN